MTNTARSFAFPRKKYSLGRNRNYQYVYRKGKNLPSRYIVLVYVRARSLKVGFSVSSKVGNAVTRNRLRRWMREDARMLLPELQEGKYVFVARVSAKDAKHSVLKAQMRSLVERAGLIKEEALTDVR